MSSFFARIVIGAAFLAVVAIHLAAPRVAVSPPKPAPVAVGGARLIPPPPGMAR